MSKTTANGFVKLYKTGKNGMFGFVTLTSGTEVFFREKALVKGSVVAGDYVEVTLEIAEDKRLFCGTVTKKKAPPGVTAPVPAPKAVKQAGSKAKPAPKPVPSPAQVKAATPKPAPVAKAAKPVPQKPTLGPIENIIGPKRGTVTCFDDGKPFGFVSVDGEARAIFVRKVVLKGIVLKKGDLVDIEYGEQLYNGVLKLTATAVDLAVEEVQPDLFVFAEAFGQNVAKAA